MGPHNSQAANCGTGSSASPCDSGNNANMECTSGTNPVGYCDQGTQAGNQGCDTGDFGVGTDCLDGGVPLIW